MSADYLLGSNRFDRLTWTSQTEGVRFTEIKTKGFGWWEHKYRITHDNQNHTLSVTRINFFFRNGKAVSLSDQGNRHKTSQWLVRLLLSRGSILSDTEKAQILAQSAVEAHSLRLLDWMSDDDFNGQLPKFGIACRTQPDKLAHTQNKTLFIFTAMLEHQPKRAFELLRQKSVEFQADILKRAFWGEPGVTDKEEFLRHLLDLNPEVIQQFLRHLLEPSPENPNPERVQQFLRHLLDLNPERVQQFLRHLPDLEPEVIQQFLRHLLEPSPENPDPERVQQPLRLLLDLSPERVQQLLSTLVEEARVEPSNLTLLTNLVKALVESDPQGFAEKLKSGNQELLKYVMLIAAENPPSAEVTRFYSEVCKGKQSPQLQHALKVIIGHANAWEAAEPTADLLTKLHSDKSSACLYAMLTAKCNFPSKLDDKLLVQTQKATCSRSLDEQLHILNSHLYTSEALADFHDQLFFTLLDQNINPRFLELSAALLKSENVRVLLSALFEEVRTDLNKAELLTNLIKAFVKSDPQLFAEKLKSSDQGNQELLTYVMLIAAENPPSAEVTRFYFEVCKGEQSPQLQHALKVIIGHANACKAAEPTADLLTKLHSDKSSACLYAMLTAKCNFPSELGYELLHQTQEATCSRSLDEQLCILNSCFYKSRSLSDFHVHLIFTLLDQHINPSFLALSAAVLESEKVGILLLALFEEVRADLNKTELFTNLIKTIIKYYPQLFAEKLKSSNQELITYVMLVAAEKPPSAEVTRFYSGLCEGEQSPPLQNALKVIIGHANAREAVDSGTDLLSLYANRHPDCLLAMIMANCNFPGELGDELLHEAQMATCSRGFGDQLQILNSILYTSEALSDFHTQLISMLLDKSKNTSFSGLSAWLFQTEMHFWRLYMSHPELAAQLMMERTSEVQARCFKHVFVCQEPLKTKDALHLLDTLAPCERAQVLEKLVLSDALSEGSVVELQKYIAADEAVVTEIFDSANHQTLIKKISRLNTNCAVELIQTLPLDGQVTILTGLIQRPPLTDSEVEMLQKALSDQQVYDLVFQQADILEVFALHIQTDVARASHLAFALNVRDQAHLTVRLLNKDFVGRNTLSFIKLLLGRENPELDQLKPELVQLKASICNTENISLLLTRLSHADADVALSLCCQQPTTWIVQVIDNIMKFNHTSKTVTMPTAGKRGIMVPKTMNHNSPELERERSFCARLLSLAHAKDAEGLKQIFNTEENLGLVINLCRVEPHYVQLIHREKLNRLLSYELLGAEEAQQYLDTWFSQFVSEEQLAAVLLEVLPKCPYGFNSFMIPAIAIQRINEASHYTKEQKAAVFFRAPHSQQFEIFTEYLTTDCVRTYMELDDSSQSDILWRLLLDDTEKWHEVFTDLDIKFLLPMVKHLVSYSDGKAIANCLMAFPVPVQNNLHKELENSYYDIAQSNSASILEYLNLPSETGGKNNTTLREAHIETQV